MCIMWAYASYEVPDCVIPVGSAVVPENYDDVSVGSSDLVSYS